MAGYSLRQMRREYRAVIRLPVMGLVALLLSSALLGAWGATVRDDLSQSRRVLFAVAAALCLGLLCAGLYLVFSDEKWLLRHTAYGRTLARLGDAKGLIRQIDDEALRADYDRSFALFGHWLVLYLPHRTRLEPRGFQALPVPRGDVRGMAVRPIKDGEYEMTVLTRQGDYTLALWDRQELEAMRRWISAGRTEA